MLNVFLSVIFPILIIAGAGAGLKRWRDLPAAPFNQAMLYLLSPALVVDSLLNADLPLEVSGRVLGHDRPMQSGFILSTAFPNAGNMRLPVVLLAFGEQALVVAVIIFATQAILGWSLGVFIAARSHHGGLAPLKKTLKLPVVWAIVVALILRATGISLPSFLAEPIHMLGQAAILVMLLILGFQLERRLIREGRLSLVAALAVRLIGSVFVAYLASVLLGLEEVAQQAFIVVAAMPTAVFTTILAVEFHAASRFVSSMVISSTVLGFLTLTVLITLIL